MRLLPLLLLCTAAHADTLVLRGGPDAQFTMRSATGDGWICTVPTLLINLSPPTTITSASGSGANCTQTQAPPAASVGSVRFSAASYVASAAIGRTFVTVARTGNNGALHAVWAATGNVNPKSGDLYWPDGDASARFVLLQFSQPGQSTLTLPGSSAVLTIAN